MNPNPDHSYTDPGDGRVECETCGKWVHPFIHSCKGVPVTYEAAMRAYGAARAELERVTRDIDGLRSCARGESPFCDAYSLGFDTARRLAVRIAKGAPVDKKEPRSSERFAVHQTGPGTWAVQRKPVPGFRLGQHPSSPSARALEDLENARDLIASTPAMVHRHLLAPGGSRCIECGEVL